MDATPRRQDDLEEHHRLPEFGSLSQNVNPTAEIEELTKLRKASFSPFENYPANPSQLTVYSRDAKEQFEGISNEQKE